MKKYQYLLAVLALTCILMGSIKGAISYFTTYARAQGGITLNLVEETTIEERAENNKKELVVKNPDTSVPVYVRARAYTGGNYKLEYTHPGNNWTDLQPNDGSDPSAFCYFIDKETGEHAILNPGEDTGEPLVVSISRNIDENTVLDDPFNVVVIYEAVPVIYDEKGNPVEEWNQPLIEIDNGGN